MYLFFDTETTGLPLNWNAPVHDIANWPRVVQLAYLYYDEKGSLIDQGDFIIKPEGFTIPIESSRIHGITNEMALHEGFNLTSILKTFNDLIIASTYIVAHNISFDEKVVGAEFIRTNITSQIQQKRRICTMKSSVDFCQILGNYGYKWPKLSELHYRLFKTDFDEAHNAMIDISITAKCFWEMRRLGII